jgi:hypothetical protein
MKILRNIDVIKMGLRIRVIEIPALFKAISSKFSPSFPKVIKEDNKTESGIASGIVIKEK